MLLLNDMLYGISENRDDNTYEATIILIAGAKKYVSLLYLDPEPSFCLINNTYIITNDKSTATVNGVTGGW